MTTLPRRVALTVAALAALTITAGCAGAESDSSSGTSTAMSQLEAPARAGAEQADAGGARAEAVDGDDAAAMTDVAERADVAAESPAVISTGTVSLQATDVGKARFDVRKVVDRFRGTVTDQETTTGEKGMVTTARLVLRVPSDSFADTVAELEQAATLISSATSGEDVSAEVIDVEARIRAQRKSVERVEALLARATTIQEIVSIESQLSSRQAELDSLVSRSKHLADQTSLSTINVFIEQAPEKPGKDDTDDATGFLGALEDSWHALVSASGATLTAIGYALPWLGLLVLITVAGRLVVRRRTAPATGPDSPART